MVTLVLRRDDFRRMPTDLSLRWLDGGTPAEEAEFLRVRRRVWDGDRPGCLAEYRDEGYTYVLAFAGDEPAGVAAEYAFEPGRYMVAATAALSPSRGGAILPLLIQAVCERVLAKAGEVRFLYDDGDQASAQAALTLGFRHEWQ